MTRNTASALGFATTIAVAAAATAFISSSALAESIAEYTTPFASTLTRSEVQAEFTGRAEVLRAASSEWATQYNEPVALKSAETRANARAEYRSARQEVLAVTAEDSGSAYFLRQAMRVKASAIMGGPAR